jgi:hypothetical protein
MPECKDAGGKRKGCMASRVLLFALPSWCEAHAGLWCADRQALQDAIKGSDGDAVVVGASAEMMLSTLNHDASLLRNYIIKESSTPHGILPSLIHGLLHYPVPLSPALCPPVHVVHSSLVHGLLHRPVGPSWRLPSRCLARRPWPCRLALRVASVVGWRRRCLACLQAARSRQGGAQLAAPSAHVAPAPCLTARHTARH